VLELMSAKARKKRKEAKKNMSEIEKEFEWISNLKKKRTRNCE